MNKEFIPYPEALVLKELGFDEPCFAYYTDKESKFIPASYSQEGTEYPTNSDLIQDWISAPLYQQAFRWFREEHNYLCNIELMGHSLYCANIHLDTEEYRSTHLMLKNICHEQVVDLESYEEAELACLRKLIEIVKENKDE